MKDIKTLPFQVSQNIVELCIADTELQKRHKAEAIASHKNLWATVHAEYPELDKDADFTLNAKYAEQGVVMIDTRERGGKKSLGEMLGRMLKDVN